MTEQSHQRNDASRDAVPRQTPPTSVFGRIRRRLIAWAAALPHAALGPRLRDAVGILMYHRVVPRPRGCPPPTWNVPPARFRAQLAGLLRRGFEAWSLSRVLEHAARGLPVDRNVFVVTFDDGYECVHQHAMPVLRELGVPATVFVPTAYLDSLERFPADDWSQAGSPGVEGWRLLSTEQYREMLASGLVELGTHTHTHGDFRGRPSQLFDELQHSQRVLEEKFGIAPVPFAFPYGSRAERFASRSLREAARRSGVRCVLTTEPELVRLGGDPFNWGRFNVEPWDTAVTLAARLAGWYDLLRAAGARLRRSGRRSLSPRAQHA